MTRTRLVSGLIGTGMLAFFAAGCDDGAGDALTPEEAAALAGLIGRSVMPLADQPLLPLPPDGTTAPTAHAAGAKEYDFDKPCSEGGSVNLSGVANIAFEDEGIGMEVDGTVAFRRCGETTDDGVAYTLTGSVDHLFQVVASWSDGTVHIEVDGSANGSVGWENEDEGSSGVCEVDVTVDIAIDIDKENGTWDVEGGVTGTVCGISVDVDAGDWSKKGGKKGA